MASSFLARRRVAVPDGRVSAPAVPPPTPPSAPAPSMSPPPAPEVITPTPSASHPPPAPSGVTSFAALKARAAAAQAGPAPVAPTVLPTPPAPKRRQVEPPAPARLAQTIAPALYVGAVRDEATFTEREPEAPPAERPPVVLEQFARPLATSLNSPGLSTLFAFLDLRSFMERAHRNAAIAGRTPEEQAKVLAEYQAQVDQMTALVHEDGDLLALHRKFYHIGTISADAAKRIPRLLAQTEQPARVDDIPLVDRDYLTRYMMSWAPGLGPNVRQCRDIDNCCFVRLCRIKEHPDPIQRSQFLPGRAFLTPKEEAEGCTEPRFCYYCIVMIVNVM